MKNLLSLFFFLLIIACVSKKTPEEKSMVTPADTASALSGGKKIVPDNFKEGGIIENIQCKNDASKSFALYIPRNINSNETRPILFFFDAHGDPVLPLTKYRKLADEFGYILVGSYNSKNGNDWQATSGIWSALFADIKSRIAFDDKRIYTGGFSGGAKVAAFIALNNTNIAGVVLNSAGFPETQQQPPSGNFNLAGIAGKGDMNMTELVSLNQMLDQTQIKHQLLFFDGKHEWCPAETMRDAFVWFRMNAMKNKVEPVDQKLIDDFIKHIDKKIEQCNKSHDMLAACDANKMASNYLDAISDKAPLYKSKATQIENSQEYQKQVAAYNSLLEREKNIKSNFASALQQNTDVNFWKQTVSDLKSKTKSKGDDAAMYNRVLSYLSLAAYSFSNRNLNSGDNATASKYIELYKIIDPENAEAWYFSAMLFARAHDYNKAKQELHTAVEKGFNDWKRMNEQEEFKGMDLSDVK